MSDNRTTTTNTHASIHWGWYATSLLIAIVMAVSSAVISFNFMVAHTPLLISATCAACGFLLNLLLYWRDKAKQLQSFAHELANKPTQTLHHCFTSILPSVAIGFLTFISYFDQLHSLPATAQIHVPILPLSLVLAVANVLGSVVLFYEKTPDTDSSPHIESPTKASLLQQAKEIWTQAKAAPAILKKMRLQEYCSALISFTQSALYSATNYHCIQRSLAILAPFFSNRYMQTALILAQRYCHLSPLFFSSALSLFMTAFLFRTELSFNYDRLKKATLPAIVPYYRSVLACMLFLNGFANGWITLGDFTYLSPMIQAFVVLVGTTVSYAVMQNEVINLEKATNLSDLFQQFLPLEQDQVFNVLHAVLLAPVIGFYSYFMFQPAALQALFSFSPTLVIGSFFCLIATGIPPAIEACQQAALTVQHAQAYLSSLHLSSNQAKPRHSTEKERDTSPWHGFFTIPLSTLFARPTR
jgi:hypothetical protein